MRLNNNREEKVLIIARCVFAVIRARVEYPTSPSTAPPDLKQSDDNQAPPKKFSSPAASEGKAQPKKWFAAVTLDAKVHNPTMFAKGLLLVFIGNFFNWAPPYQQYFKLSYLFQPFFAPSARADTAADEVSGVNKLKAQQEKRDAERKLFGNCFSSPLSD